jgi:hypothetical protein
MRPTARKVNVFLTNDIETTVVKARFSVFVVSNKAACRAGPIG